MPETIQKDPDNKWLVPVDWNDFINDLQDRTGGVVTITASDWDVGGVLTEEGDTPTDDVAGFTYLVGSGGLVDAEYDIVNTITYTFTHSTFSVTDLTQDITFTIKLVDQ